MGKQYWSPTNALIIGTKELIPAVAKISGINEDGTPDYENAQGTEVFWDDGKTVERDGKILFLDESGDEWTFDQLRPAPENGEEADEDEPLGPPGWSGFNPTRR